MSRISKAIMFPTGAHVLPDARQRRSWLRLPGRFFALIVAAQRLARERQELAELDAAQLRDAGLTEADRRAALHKLVWRR